MENLWGFSENTPLRRLSTPSIETIRTVGHFLQKARMHIVVFPPGGAEDSAL